MLLFSWRIFMRKTHSQAEIWAFKKMSILPIYWSGDWFRPKIPPQFFLENTCEVTVQGKKRIFLTNFQVPTNLRVILVPWEQYCPCEASERKLQRVRKNLAVTVRLDELIIFGIWWIMAAFFLFWAQSRFCFLLVICESHIYIDSESIRQVNWTCIGWFWWWPKWG